VQRQIECFRATRRLTWVCGSNSHVPPPTLPNAAASSFLPPGARPAGATPRGRLSPVAVALTEVAPAPRQIVTVMSSSGRDERDASVRENLPGRNEHERIGDWQLAIGAQPNETLGYVAPGDRGWGHRWNGWPLALSQIAPGDIGWSGIWMGSRRRTSVIFHLDSRSERDWDLRRTRDLVFKQSKPAVGGDEREYPVFLPLAIPAGLSGCTVAPKLWSGSMRQSRA
jgi:hypothetical protein